MYVIALLKFFANKTKLIVLYNVKFLQKMSSKKRKLPPVGIFLAIFRDVSMSILYKNFKYVLFAKNCDCDKPLGC